MDNERNDRRYGYLGERGGYGADRGRTYGYDQGRDQERSYRDRYGYGDQGRREYRGDRDYGRNPQGYDYQDRGFFERAGDEVRSWFGDEDAERRRRQDERYDEREGGYTRSYGDRSSGGSDYGSRGSGQSYGDRGYGQSRGGAFGGERSWDRGGSAYGSGQGNWNQGRSGGRHHHDENYRSWRDRQMESFDRDYDEYRRENQGRFESEFGTWRQTRQGQRDQVRNVKEHQEVVGSDGQHVGKVDHVQGDRIKLAKDDSVAGGHHHTIPCSWIQSVDDKVTLNKTADQAKQHWRDEQREQGGMFGSGDNTDNRATNLNRSFSGS